METLSLIHDFALILLMAAFCAIGARLLHIPLLLGYIFGGFLLGLPWRGIFLIHDSATIQQMSELGVVFLMFYIGLEFNLKRLRQLFSSAIVALVLQTIFMLFLGRILAPFLGWGGLNGLFLGGLLAISSTMITLPILADQGALNSNFARLSIGILILEDILAILLLVILSGIAITGHFEWNAIGRVTFLVGVFVVGVFVVGRMLAPHLIRLLLRFNSGEVLTVAMVGILLGVGLLAEMSHFSIALGAFLAGAIFSQTALSEAIGEHTEPIRNIFTAIFFISVGLMIDPALILKYIGPILLLTFLTFLFKVFSCQLGLLLSGQSGEDSLRAALSKAQIGEFSFVIAALGISLGVTDGALLNIAVGVSVGTIICTAFFSPRGSKIYGCLRRLLPHAVLEIGRFYHSLLAIIRCRMSQNMLWKVARRPLLYIIFNTLLFSGLLFSMPLLTHLLLRIDFLNRWTLLINVSSWMLTALLSLPLLLPIVRQLNRLLFALAENALARTDSQSRRMLRPRLGAIFQSLIFAFILLIFGGVFLSVASATLPKGTALYGFLLLLIFAGIFLWKRILRVNMRLERYFIETFNEDLESQVEAHRCALLEKFHSKFPLQLDILEVIMREGFEGCGRRIADLPLRSQFGAYVVAVRRGNYLSFGPNLQMPLFPQDRLIIMAKPADLQSIREFFNQSAENFAEFSPNEDLEIDSVCLGSCHALIGKSLLEANLRHVYGVSVVGICRGKIIITLPKAGELLLADDVLVIIGAKSAMERFKIRWPSFLLAS